MPQSEVFGIAAVCAALTVCGCGTSVPGLQGFSGNKVAETQLVQSIVQNVTCEVRDAVNHLYQKLGTNHTFLDNWGAQIALNLTIDEKGELNPTANWLPNAIFGLGGGIDVSSDATRNDTINTYHTIAQLRALKACVPGERPDGAYLLASDLKLEDLLFDSVTLESTGQSGFSTDTKSGPLGQNVIQHDVKFIVTATGTLTPAWKLSRVIGVNQSGTFLTAQHTRTNDLTVTLGPTNDNATGPSDVASSFASSAQYGITVSNGLRGRQP